MNTWLRKFVAMHAAKIVLLLLLSLHAPAAVASVRRSLLLASSQAAAALVAPVPAAPDSAACPVKCGNVCIPYPFVISDGRLKDVDRGLGNFNVTCNVSFTPPRPYLFNIEVMSISLDEGVMVVNTAIVYRCYNSPLTLNSSFPKNVSSSRGYGLHFVGWPYMISPVRNEFTATGCSTTAYLSGKDDSSFYTGCTTTCRSVEEAALDDEQCTGLGCCQLTSIPTNLSTMDVTWNTVNDVIEPNRAWNYSACKYAFVAQKGWYKFKRRDLGREGINSFETRDGVRIVPTVLDWAIRSNGTCSSPPAKAGMNSAPACVSEHSQCSTVTNGKGYLCHCSKGYAGNPYIVGGCTNIDECKLRKEDHGEYEKLYPCSAHSTCEDTDGDYECKCHFPNRRDGNNNKVCRPILNKPAIATLATIGVAIILAILVSYIVCERKRRKRSLAFDKNGGKLLESMNISIYTREQLDRMTKKNSTKIGNGAFGEVYMGTTDDNQRVAVKCSIMQGAALGKDDFVNEISIQLQVRHNNLVRLVGCCLETDVPMLVFEYISNGSLENVLHGADQHALSLPERMDIAVGSAEALSYMHSQGRHTIVHGDIKPGNILLGDNFIPKVSDFGSSKLALVTKHKKCFGAISGDMNYIDPAYMKTNNFTEKSDVYSFGVVLLELITRKKAKYDVVDSLPLNFVKAYKDEDARRKMYDQEMMLVPGAIECLDRIGGIVVQCLKDDIDERPTMAEVAEKLILVRSTVRACFPDAIGNSSRSNASIGSNRSDASR